MAISNKIISIFLVLFAIISFFTGFYLDEISMGAGGFNGDFIFVKKSIILFNENSILNSIKLFSETSNRPPLIYILHKLLNPFYLDEINFRKVVFLISLFVPILFYFCLSEKFKQVDRNLLLLLSSVIFFNPFFRTSSFWGLEENYAIITTLASFFFIFKLQDLEYKKSSKLYFIIFLITFFSSLSIYFDQKFLIIPLFCFFKIILSELSNKIKFVCFFFYIIFSIPYLFLINLWGGIFPSNIYNIGSQFYFHHFGYALTILAFIFFPFIFLKSQKFKDLVLNFVSGKKILIILLLITFYLTILFFFYDDSFLNNKLDGGGIIKKISFILFDNLIYKKIFTFLAILISCLFIFFFIENNKLNLLFTLYFLILSIIVRPFFQEYFDPIVFLLVIFLYKIKFKITYIKVYFFYFYFLFFLFGTNLYYN